jgi:hypothetical protein
VDTKEKCIVLIAYSEFDYILQQLLPPAGEKSICVPNSCHARTWYISPFTALSYVVSSSRTTDCEAFPVSMLSLDANAWRAVNLTCNSSTSSRGLHQRGYCRKRWPAHCVNFPGVRPVTLFQQDAKPEECLKPSALCGVNGELRQYSLAFCILQRRHLTPHCTAFRSTCMHEPSIYLYVGLCILTYCDRDFISFQSLIDYIIMFNK